MNLTQLHNRSMFTKRRIGYYATLEEMLGFDGFTEDSKLIDQKGVLGQRIYLGGSGTQI